MDIQLIGKTSSSYCLGKFSQLANHSTVPKKHLEGLEKREIIYLFQSKYLRKKQKGDSGLRSIHLSNKGEVPDWSKWI